MGETKGWFERHPIIAWSVVFVVFAVWTFPEWLGQVWPLFTDKKLPDFLAERGWDGMTTWNWLSFLFSVLYTPVVTLIMLAFLWWLVRLQGERGNEESKRGSHDVSVASIETPEVDASGLPEPPVAPQISQREEREEITYRESRRRFAEPWLRQQEFQDALKQLGGGAAQVQIVYADEEDISFANFLFRAFEQANWKAKISLPQPHLNSSVDGLHVLGYDATLVDAVARAFERAEVLGIERKVEPSSVGKNDPRWTDEQHSLRIVIGN